jgi:hypothetical protein
MPSHPPLPTTPPPPHQVAALSAMIAVGAGVPLFLKSGVDSFNKGGDVGDARRSGTLPDKFKAAPAKAAAGPAKAVAAKVRGAGGKGLGRWQGDASKPHSSGWHHMKHRVGSGTSL